MSKPRHPTYNPNLPNLNGKGWAAMGYTTKALALKHKLVINDKPTGQYYRNARLAKNCAWIPLYLIGGNEISLKLDKELPLKTETTTRKIKI